MKEFTDLRSQQQEKVNAYFRSQSTYWKDVYQSAGLRAKIIQDRHARMLSWIDCLALPGLAPNNCHPERSDCHPERSEGSKVPQVLEIGCGAGLMAVALAQRGFRVYAIDSIEAMVELARSQAANSGAAELISVNIGDIYSLAFEDNSFDLVFAIGVLPWLAHAELAIQELARVTRPDGYVILTTANRKGVSNLLDPWQNPALMLLKQRVKEVCERGGLLRRTPGMNFHDCRFIDEALQRSEFVKIKGMTHGFEFSFRHRTILPEPLSIAIHHWLQRLADRNVPVLRSTGMAYFVLARKRKGRLIAPIADLPATRRTSTVGADYAD